MAKPPAFPQFDADIAARFIEASNNVPGLPGYLGVRIVELTAGRLVAEMDVRNELLTPFHTLHGGVMAGLVDHTLGCVLYPLMARGQWAATTEFKLNLLAPVTKGKLRAEAEIVSLTRATAVVRIQVENEGRLAAIAQGTVLIRDPRPA